MVWVALELLDEVHSLVESSGFIGPYTFTLVAWVYKTLIVRVTLAILDEVHLMNPADLLDHTHSLWSLDLQHLDGMSFGGVWGGSGPKSPYLEGKLSGFVIFTLWVPVSHQTKGGILYCFTFLSDMFANLAKSSCIRSLHHLPHKIEKKQSTCLKL
jgi:hypothetical protein